VSRRVPVFIHRWGVNRDCFV